MKYLNTYKLFESSWLKEIVPTLEDICDELRDNGYSVDISMRGNNYESSPIGITVEYRKPAFPGVSVDTDYTLEPFSYVKIKDIFDRMIQYMKIEGWDCVDLQYYQQKMGGGRWVTFSGKQHDKYKSFRIVFRK